MPGLPIVGVPVPGSRFGTIVVRKQDHKNSCVVAAPGNIVIATMGDGDTIDGVVVNEGEAVLLPNQTDLKEVGRYDVGPAGGPSVRSADFDQDSEVTNGVAVIAVLGTQAGTWVVTTADPIIVGTTEIVMVQNPPGPHTHTHASTTGQTATDHHDNSSDPTADEKAALAGTSGAPAVGNKYVTDADARNSDARAPTAHESSHADGGSDELAVVTLAESAAPGNDVSQALRPDGTGGVAFSDVAHADITGVGATDHHDNSNDPTVGQKGALVGTGTPSGGNPYVSSDDSRMIDDRNPTAHGGTHENGGSDEISVSGLSGTLADEQPPSAHKTNHEDGGSDELPVASLAEAAAPGNDVSQALRPDGSGGVAFSDVTHGDLASVGQDDHKTVNTLATTDDTVTTIATIAIPDDTVVSIEARITGRRTNAGDRYSSTLRRTVFREAAGGATLLGNPDLFDRSSSPQYDSQIIVSGNNALIQVEGNTGHNINWRCVHETNSVS